MRRAMLALMGRLLLVVVVLLSAVFVWGVLYLDDNSPHVFF